jgi:hypothetical protein
MLVIFEILHCVVGFFFFKVALLLWEVQCLHEFPVKLFLIPGVVGICSDISEEHMASIIRVTELVQVDAEL